ncbi:unnamed protein product [Meloidogyne enterolobii]|uniref:Uncharacterized protein n=1 Tax=Meloidogyne enterolobii TaxID=390850 RepID=A0ACB0YJU8_MELEN
MHTGTTCDDVLRENLDCISKATDWNKFNAVASLGLIHKGHEREARKILDPYLPRGDVALKVGLFVYMVCVYFLTHFLRFKRGIPHFWHAESTH